MEEAIVNFTRIEEDPFAAIPLNVTNDTETLNELYRKWQPTTFQLVMNYLFIALELAKFLLGVAAVASDVLLIFFLLRYKRLRKGINMFIVNFAIMNLMYYLLYPLFLLFHVLFFTGIPYLSHMYCYMGMVEMMVLLMCLNFSFLLGLEWTISYKIPHIRKRIGVKYKHKVIGLYILWIFLIILSCSGCHVGIQFGRTIFLGIVPIFALGLAGMHVCRRKTVLTSDHLKTEYALWICTIAIGAYIPVYLLDVIFTWTFHYFSGSAALIIIVIDYILTFFTTASPIFILYYLSRWNKYVQMAFDTTFKRSVRSYGADNLDDASDNEEIVENGADKTMQNNVTNAIDTHTIMVP